MENNTEIKIKGAVKSTSESLGELIGQVGVWFLSAAFIMWGWEVFAPLVGAPQFTFWEIFAMRMAFSSIVSIFQKRK